MESWTPAPAMEGFCICIIIVTVLVLYGIARLGLCIYKAYSVRTRYHFLPALQRHPVWGNTFNAGARLKPSLKRHPDYGFEEIWRELDEPGCFLVDLAPFHDRGFLILAEPQYAEAIVNATEAFKYSVPKSDSYRFLKPIIGSDSMVTKEGAVWRAMRKRFNPGFQPKHIHSLTHTIASRMDIFVGRLQTLAQSGEIFKMSDYAKDLTTDIILLLTTGRDLHAQTTPESLGEKGHFGMLTANRRLSEMVYAMGQGVGLYMIDPIRPFQLAWYGFLLNHKLGQIVRECIRSTGTIHEPASIIHLIVSGLRPSRALVRTCVDQIKSFLFAGHDTSTSLIQWICYEMSKANHSSHHAAVLSRLRREHDAVFGPGPFSALNVLFSKTTVESDSILNSKLPYTTAFIKETLRLHPPAATVRTVPWEATSFSLPLPIQPFSVAGLQVYPCVYLIQRNHRIWGPDANIFNPDRWLNEAYLATTPIGAYRPFERGPRSCIGQELAMMEAKMVLASLARGFTFEKIGLNGVAGGPGPGITREVWSDYKVTSVPVDGMVMRVRLNENVAL